MGTHGFSQAELKEMPMGTPETIAAETKRREDLELAVESLVKLAPHLEQMERNACFAQDSRLKQVVKNVLAILAREKGRLTEELLADTAWLEGLIGNRPQHAQRLGEIARRVKEYRDNGNEPVHEQES